MCTAYIENNNISKRLNPLSFLQSDNEQHNYNGFCRPLLLGFFGPEFRISTIKQHSFSLMEISFTIKSNGIQLWYNFPNNTHETRPLFSIFHSCLMIVSIHYVQWLCELAGAKKPTTTKYTEMSFVWQRSYIWLFASAIIITLPNETILLIILNDDN